MADGDGSARAEALERVRFVVGGRGGTWGEPLSLGFRVNTKCEDLARTDETCTPFRLKQETLTVPKCFCTTGRSTPCWASAERAGDIAGPQLRYSHLPSWVIRLAIFLGVMIELSSEMTI